MTRIWNTTANGDEFHLLSPFKATVSKSDKPSTPFVQTYQKDTVERDRTSFLRTVCQYRQTCKTDTVNGIGAHFETALQSLWWINGRSLGWEPILSVFSGETVFQWSFPCHPTDLVYFRKRIGKEGVKKIFQVSIDLHGKKAKEKEVVVDTTVQEKNITFPTDTKLCTRIINHCVGIATKERIILRQSYQRTTKKLMLAQRFRNHPKNRKKAVAAQRKLKTIAGRLVRELEWKLPASSLRRYSQEIALFQQIVAQKRNSTNKIDSSHEPQVYCIS